MSMYCISTKLVQTNIMIVGKPLFQIISVDVDFKYIYVQVLPLPQDI